MAISFLGFSQRALRFFYRWFQGGFPVTFGQGCIPLGGLVPQVNLGCIF
jgi:hypothetical protein